MTDKTETHGEWADIQQQYWSHLNQLQQQLTGQSNQQQPDWQYLNRWWQSIEPDASDLTQNFMKKMMGHGEALFGLAERCCESKAGDNGASVDSQKEFFNDLREQLLKAKTGQEPISQLMAFCELPFDFLQQAGAILAPFQSKDFTGSPDTLNTDFLERMLGMPGLGITREEQTLHKSFAKHILEYQQALKIYSEFYSDLALYCTDEMEAELKGIEEQGVSIDSATELYSVWVGVCERCYGKRVRTTEYAALQGRLVNSTLVVKREMNELINSNLSKVQIPTSTQVNELQRCVHDTRQELKNLKAELTELKKTASQAIVEPDLEKQPVVKKKRRVAKKKQSRKKS